MKMEDDARDRIDWMEFTQSELDFILADWSNWDEHVAWLLTATREEIVDWVAPMNFIESITQNGGQ